MIGLITDRSRLSSGADSIDRLVDLVAAAGQAGIELVQIRERDLETRALSTLVSRCVAAVQGTGTKVVVNDRADVAVAARADGVHLRSDSMPASAVRQLVGDHSLIGRSVHTAAEAAAITTAGGVDYLIFGTMYQTASKPLKHPIATLDELSAACRAAAGVPVLAIGGMTVERAVEVAGAGASGVAGIGLFVPPRGVSADNHVRTIAIALRRAFDTCETVS